MSWVAENPPEVGELFFGGTVSGGDAPTFTAQPQPTTVDEYSNASFSCEVTGGTTPYTYQWKKNGANIGTDSNLLSFATAATDNGASITCVVTDSVGSVITSNAATLGVTIYAFTMDGSTQYYTLDSIVTIPAATDFSISVTARFNTSGFYIAAKLVTQEYRFSILSSGSVFIPSTSIGTLSAALWDRMRDGETHKLTIARVGTTYTAYVDDDLSQVLTTSGTTSQMQINSFGAHWSTSNPSFTGRMYNMEVVAGGVTLLDLPMRNKSTGATQAAIIGPNATIVNYNANGWVEL